MEDTKQYTGMAPTAQQLFGTSPWLTNPTLTLTYQGTSTKSAMVPYNFATLTTAVKVASIVGALGVVQVDSIPPGATWHQDQSNYMVMLRDGTLHNAGQIASMFDHGFSDALVEAYVRAEIGDEMFKFATLPRVEAPPPPPVVPRPVEQFVFPFASYVGMRINCPAGEQGAVGFVRVDPKTGYEWTQGVSPYPFAPAGFVYLYERTK